MTDKHMSTKQKIDQVLGIGQDQSIEDFLDQMTPQEDVQTLSSAFDDITDDVKEEIKTIDSAIVNIKIGENTEFALSSVQNSFAKIDELIDYSKKIFTHVYTGIVTTDLIDPELIQSISKLLEAMHLSISEFLSMYKDRQKYFDKVKLMVLDQQNKKELLRIKHQYNMELAKMRNSGSTSELSADNLVGFSQEDILKMLEGKSY